MGKDAARDCVGTGVGRGRTSTDIATWVSCQRFAALERDPARKVDHLLVYLETHPLGAYNRRAAEEVERLIAGTPSSIGERLWKRLRDLRDASMPPAQPGSWDGRW